MNSLKVQTREELGIKGAEGRRGLPFDSRNTEEKWFGEIISHGLAQPLAHRNRLGAASQQIGFAVTSDNIVLLAYLSGR